MNFHSFLLNLSDKINLKMSDKNVALSNILVSTIHGKTKS